MSDCQWIAETTVNMMRDAQRYFVPAQDQWLSELPGDLGLRLWALGATQEEADAALARLIAAWLKQRMPAGQRKEVAA